MLSQTQVRAAFSAAMSEMYRLEVPKYDILLDVITEVNTSVAKTNPEKLRQLGLTLERVTDERHGAIRVGTPADLQKIARLFKVMGMYPCRYYDLTVAGHPIHSTAFRPLTREDLAANPFRMFTSMLRVDLLPDEIQTEAKQILEDREIFSNELYEILDLHDQQGGLQEEQLDSFLKHATAVFRWHKQAAIDKSMYERLKKFSPIAADIIGFKGPHINHLTPVALDIDLAFAMMQDRGLETIENIQGPPLRNIPVFLRQTSFRAITEETVFPNPDGSSESGQHRARFGEIESRGAALTPKGADLYDELLFEVNQLAQKTSNKSYPEILAEVFADFPDSFAELRKEKLAYLHYHLTPKGEANIGNQQLPEDLDGLLAEGYLDCSGIVYEDFLPVSAARIFDSNLNESDGRLSLRFASFAEYKEYEAAQKIKFEKDLGQKTIDVYEIYAQEEAESLRNCLHKLGTN